MIYRILPVLLCLFLFCGCYSSSDRQQGGGYPKKIIPKIEGDQFQIQTGTSLNPNQGYYEKQPLEISLPPNNNLIQVINKNLDVDSSDEQIIAVKTKDDTDSPIRIILADYDSVRGHYTKAWEGRTDAVQVNTFTISLKDMVGDHQLEIVCRGTDSKGDLTLNIFRRTPSSSLEINYYSICRVISDGTIDILENERNLGYQEGFTLGDSFPIIAYRSDTEPPPGAHIIKETYFFYRPTGRYEIESSVRLSSEKVEESQLGSLITSSTPDLYEEYLHGFWYKLGQDEQGAKNEVVLFFDSENREIILCSGEVQEIYQWKGSKQFYKNLTIFSENKLLQSISPQFTITLASVDQIKLSISEPSENDQWGGTYVKVKKELEDSIFVHTQRVTEPLSLGLAGRYKSKDDTVLLFEKPHFTWIDKDAASYEGGYTIYKIRQKDTFITVLFLKFVMENGLSVKDKVFILKYNEEKKENYTVKTLTLVPAKVSIHGITEKIEEPIIFTQETNS
jgi:hypothetical protein